MKNKVYYILLCLLVSFAFMNNVFAGSITVSVTPETQQVVKGEEGAVTIRLTADEAIKSCKFILESDENVVYKSISSAGGWSASSSEGILAENSGTEIPNNLAIVQVKYTINGNGKVTVKTEKCVSTTDEKEYTAPDVTVNFTVIDPADDTTLKSLEVINGEPFGFKSDNLSYGVPLNSSTFGLKMEASNADYQDDIVVKDASGNVITDFENITFSDPTGRGLMELFITVNEKTTYELVLQYEDKELDNSLESIKINGADLSLEDDRLEYTIDVESDVESVLIEATLKDSEHFQIGKNSIIGQISIKDTAYSIIVVEPKSSDLGATSKTYYITIKRNSGSSGTTPSNPGNSDKEPTDETPKPSTGGEVVKNPATGDISMFVMALILIGSLVGSLILYQKNLEGYR